MLRVMNDNHAVELQVFIDADCDVCKRALSLAESVGSDYPSVAVRVINMSEQVKQRDDVFAVPTFVLNGEVFSLGNPQEESLQEAIESLLQRPNSM